MNFRPALIAICMMASLPPVAETLYYDDMVYTGDVAKGKPHGQGTMEYTSGQIYVGEYFLGTKKGKGTFTWPDEQKYVGE